MEAEVTWLTHVCGLSLHDRVLLWWLMPFLFHHYQYHSKAQKPAVLPVSWNRFTAELPCFAMGRLSSVANLQPRPSSHRVSPGTWVPGMAGLHCKAVLLGFPGLTVALYCDTD